MSDPIRVFLLRRSISAEWSVQVYRDFESVRKAWKSRAEIDGSAVFHIGFTRPPAREFELTASSFPGQVLVTASAVFNLPNDYSCSSRPIGTVQGLPVHLALTGWGYEVADPSVEVAAPAPTQTFSGWVAEFVASSDEAKMEFERLAILSDEGYFQNESRLSADLRRSAGIFRFRAVFSGSLDDPCAFASASPPWLQERAFDTIDLTVRVSNVLANNGITKVSDLTEWSPSRLLSLQNFGRTSARDLRESLEAVLREGPWTSSAERRTDDAEKSGFIACLRQSLALLSERERDIVGRRMGFETPVQTLQEIADIYDLTRERVRQVEAKVLTRLAKENFWDDLLSQKLNSHLFERNFPLPFKGIEAADPWFRGIGEFEDVMRYVLANICEIQIGIVRIDAISYFSCFDQAAWDERVADGRKLLESGVGKRWTEETCKQLIGNLLPSSSKAFWSLLWDRVSQFCYFAADTDGQKTLVSYGRGVEAVVEAVLSESMEPLHFTTIADLASPRFGKDIDVRRAHHAAAAVGYLFGRGLYGVERHMPDRKLLELIGDLAEEIVEAGPLSRQWHTSEILSAIIEKGPSEIEVGKLDKYLLDIALQKTTQLTGLGRMVWTRCDNPSDMLRIDIRQAIISVLQQSGRPLHTDEIKQQLVAIRGTNEHFQISASDPVLRVGPATWGLNDRDFAIKRASQPRLLDGLVGILNDRAMGIHLSELEKSTLTSVSGMTVQALFSLACTDDRLSVNSGDYLYLSDWGGPRRESLTDATRAIMNAASSPIHIDELLRAVESRTRRDFSRQELVRCLKALDYEADVRSEFWSFASESDAEGPGLDEIEALPN